MIETLISQILTLTFVVAVMITFGFVFWTIHRAWRAAKRTAQFIQWLLQEALRGKN